jgi:hypothetical protein
MGGMVCRRTADGYAVVAGTANTGRVLGIAKADSATCVASGDTNVNLLTGQFIRPCHATHTPGLSDIGKAVYASDDNRLEATCRATARSRASSPASKTTAAATRSSSSPRPTRRRGPRLQGDSLLPGRSSPRAPRWRPSPTTQRAPPASRSNDSKAMGIRWNNNATQVAVWTRFMLPRRHRHPRRTRRSSSRPRRPARPSATRRSSPSPIVQQRDSARSTMPTPTSASDLGDDRQRGGEDRAGSDAHPRGSPTSASRAIPCRCPSSRKTARSGPTTSCSSR